MCFVESVAFDYRQFALHRHIGSELADIFLLGYFREGNDCNLMLLHLTSKDMIVSISNLRYR